MFQNTNKVLAVTKVRTHPCKSHREHLGRMLWAAPRATLGLFRGLLCSSMRFFSVIKPHCSYKTHGEQQPEYPTSSERESLNSKSNQGTLFQGMLQKHLRLTQPQVRSGNLVPGLAHLGRSQFDKFQEPSSRNKTSAKQKSFIVVLPGHCLVGSPACMRFLCALAHDKMESHQCGSTAKTTKNPPSSDRTPLSAN